MPEADFSRGFTRINADRLTSVHGVGYKPDEQMFINLDHGHHGYWHHHHDGGGLAIVFGALIEAS